MALQITADCIACGACNYACLNDAIVRSTILYRIVAARCTECTSYFDAPQRLAACPIDCILPLTSDRSTCPWPDDSRDE
jgi:ferredoxin